ncbi:CdaR family protein [Marixanthomonas ophiurae]|uniref:CdaR family protein n=1 Tax=Marixanthomonas ophiurae TaxID=387659 RepID=UPI0013149FF7|nr:CdaR family protein [Marixanthomonas ophiurae]
MAILFWVLTKFSREYTATVDASIVYKSIPNETLLAENNPEELSFDLTTNGFEFFYYKIKQPVITINISDYYTKGNKTIAITDIQLTSLISNQLDKNLSVKNLSLNDLKVHLELLVSKKIPVFSKAKLSYKKGYMSLDTLKIKPDSVQLSGPSEIIKKIDSIPTKSKNFNDIDEDFQETIEVALPDIPSLSVSPKEAELSIKVQEFTQKQITLPIEVINLPQGTIIKLIPEVTIISFNVPVKDFNKISKNDFRLFCDFSNKNEKENFMLTQFSKKPIDIRDVEIKDEKIDFLIFKQDSEE